MPVRRGVRVVYEQPILQVYCIGCSEVAVYTAWYCRCTPLRSGCVLASGIPGVRYDSGHHNIMLAHDFPWIPYIEIVAFHCSDVTFLPAGNILLITASHQKANTPRNIVKNPACHMSRIPQKTHAWDPLGGMEWKPKIKLCREGSATKTLFWLLGGHDRVCVHGTMAENTRKDIFALQDSNIMKELTASDIVSDINTCNNVHVSPRAKLVNKLNGRKLPWLCWDCDACQNISG